MRSLLSEKWDGAKKMSRNGSNYIYLTYMINDINWLLLDTELKNGSRYGKITEKASFNIASEASYISIF